MGESWGGLGHEVLVRTVLAAAEMQGQMANTAGVVCVGVLAMKMAQDSAGGRYDIEELDKGWFRSSASFCCLYPVKLTLEGKLKWREKRAACWERKGQRRRKGTAGEDS